MRVKMVCLEDGITSCGFRKMAAYVSQLTPDVQSCYISTNRFRRFGNNIRGSFGTVGMLPDEEIDNIAQYLATSDLVGYSSMTGYSDLTKRVVTRLREINPEIIQVWGGIHPIIHPEDAIQSDVDAICNGAALFSLNDGRSTIDVYEGSVQVSADGRSVSIAAGEGIDLPSPARIHPAAGRPAWLLRAGGSV